ncbi:winged helix-turn-helix transcriptional regulator [Paraburkholderia bryophila]|uniref:winged helix-turn-helix transcriptional regulator n=1 Tax=Paraburkholderia bryophila TaxID=420952 RepID=UPI001ABB3577|nr:helix-turn-helix domain-containing protein [Paraburkholderia bryophila]
MSKKAPPESQIRRNRPLVPVSECGLAHTANVLGDRWALLILREAFYGVTRFDAIREDIGASKHALSSRLELLTNAGILIARPYREPGARERNEYVLTEKGRGLGPALLMLLDWGQTYLQPSGRRVSLVERSSGQTVKNAFVTEDGRTVAQADIALQICS